MGGWQKLSGRFVASAGWRRLRNFDRSDELPLTGRILHAALPLVVEEKRAVTNSSLSRNTKVHGHQETNKLFCGVPALLLFGLGVHTIHAEELSNKSTPSTGDSVLNDVPVLQFSEKTLVESQPGDAPSNSHTAKWRIYTDMGRDLFSKGRLGEAEKYFLQALEEAKKGFGESDPHVASSCNNLAELYRMKKDYERAEPLFLEAVQRLEIAFKSEDHESVGFALHNLAGTYLVQRKFDQARMCYERSLKIKERKLGQNHPEYANTLFHLGEVLRLQRNYKDAEELIRDSIRILEEGGVGHSQMTIRRMGRLVEILIHTGQLQEAENLQRKILHVLELSQGVEAKSTTMAAENLAGTLQAVGKLKEAEELLQRCFQVRQKILPPTHIQLGITMFKLASVIIQRGDDLASGKDGNTLSDALSNYENAEELLRRAVRIAERCWKDSSAARGPISLQAGPLISLLRSLDAFGRLKLRKLELATSSEEIEEGTNEAEQAFLRCLYVLDKSGLPQELATIPDVHRQHVACLRHLAGLLSSASYVHKSTSTKSQIDHLLARSERIEAELRDSNKL